MVSAIPIVRGDGPREDPTGTPAVRNSKLPTLSALDMADGLILPRGEGPSLRLEGGRGSAKGPADVGVGVCLDVGVGV